MSVIKSFHQRKTTANANAAAAYQLLVLLVSRSEDVADSEVESIVNAAGKSLDDLKGEVG